MTYTEAFLLVGLGLVFLGVWLIIVATRTAMSIATHSAIKVMKAAKR